jgi:MraZ protein
MAELVCDIDAMPNGDPNKVVLKRFIGSESVQVTVDKGGRICLPEEMAAAAGIQGEAVLVGLLDRFEIWNPERYEKVRSSDAIMAQEAFKMME